MFISQSTPPKLPIARNETVGVYCEVAGIAGYSSTRDTSTTACTHRATATKCGKAALKT